MTKDKNHTREVQILVEQLVTLTNLILNPPKSIDQGTLEDLKTAQLESINVLDQMINR